MIISDFSLPTSASHLLDCRYFSCISEKLGCLRPIMGGEGGEIIHIQTTYKVDGLLYDYITMHSYK